MTNRFFWNQANFDGLKSLAAALRDDARLEGLAAYCELREKGLRKEAFAQLDAFLTNAASWDVPVQRTLAVRVLEAGWEAHEVHQFFTDPLRKRFLEPVLEEWRAADAGNHIPTGHLGLLRGDRVLLAEALRMNSRDERVRATLASMLLYDVWYATHHLDEGSFIGDEADAAASLADAASLLAGVEDPSSVRHLNEEVEEYTALLSDWKEYQRAPEGTFPEWCRARNRKRSWSTRVYYSE